MSRVAVRDRSRAAAGVAVRWGGPRVECRFRAGAHRGGCVRGGVPQVRDEQQPFRSSLMAFLDGNSEVLDHLAICTSSRSDTGLLRIDEPNFSLADAPAKRHPPFPGNSVHPYAEIFTRHCDDAALTEEARRRLINKKMTRP